MPICLVLERQFVRLAASFARLKTGNSTAARIAMIAMTTKSSIRVNALLRFEFIFSLLVSKNAAPRAAERPKLERSPLPYAGFQPDQVPRVSSCENSQPKRAPLAERCFAAQRNLPSAVFAFLGMTAALLRGCAAFRAVRSLALHFARLVVHFRRMSRRHAAGTRSVLKVVLGTRRGFHPAAGRRSSDSRMRFLIRPSHVRLECAPNRVPTSAAFVLCKNLLRTAARFDGDRRAGGDARPVPSAVSPNGDLVSRASVVEKNRFPTFLIHHRVGNPNQFIAWIIKHLGTAIHARSDYAPA